MRLVVKKLKIKQSESSQEGLRLPALHTQLTVISDTFAHRKINPESHNHNICSSFNSFCKLHKPLVSVLLSSVKELLLT